MNVALIFYFLIVIFSPICLHAQSRPNIIFILADDMGYKDLGSYGNPYNETPSLDKMAKEGMRFSEAYATPACSPSRAALLTGKYPARLKLTQALGNNRVDPNSPVLPAQMVAHLPDSEITMAEVFKRNGYSTGMVGKWHLGDEEAVSPYSQGFDYDRVISKNGLDYYNYGISSRNETVFEDNGTVYLTDKLTDYGLEFIKNKKDKPFFLYMAYSAPHILIVPKANNLNKYLFKYNKFDGKYNPYYASMVESMDEGIGKLMDEVKKLGLEDNTLIIFMSDNGGVGMDQLGPTPTTMEPLRAWKGHVYEGGIRVPMIMYWKGKIKEGVVNQNYMTIMDFMPTLMEIIGDNHLPANMDGKSFLPMIYDHNLKYDRGPVYWHYPHFSGQGGRPAGAVRVGDWKLVKNFETGKTELFDLKKDISEKNDLTRKNPEKSKELDVLLKNWQKGINANMPVKNPDYKQKLSGTPLNK
jgi:arylsulfatase A